MKRKNKDEYSQAKAFFNISASELVNDLRQVFDDHYDQHISSCKLSEEVMIWLYRNKK